MTDNHVIEYQYLPQHVNQKPTHRRHSLRLGGELHWSTCGQMRSEGSWALPHL